MRVFRSSFIYMTFDENADRFKKMNFAGRSLFGSTRQLSDYFQLSERDPSSSQASIRIDQSQSAVCLFLAAVGAKFTQSWS